MSKFRLIQLTIFKKDLLFKEVYKIQRNYGFIIPDWQDIIDADYVNKTEAIEKFNFIKKDDKTKYSLKILKVLKK